MAARYGAHNAQAGSILLAVHDFIARSVDELSLAKGDRIELIERDDDFGDGWFLGKHLTNAKTGLFPEVYTTPAPKGTLTSASGKLRDGPAAKAAQHAATTLSASAKQQSSAGAGATNIQPSLASTVLRNSLSSSTSAPTPSTSSSTAPPAVVGGHPFTITSDSPVMSETLSVIDEHITDMKTPRSSMFTTNGTNKRDTISSVYSVQPPAIGRRSYIAGRETDEEEQQTHTEEEVMAWPPARVAEYLEDIGVEKSHCNVFLEQDIAGEVLLAMDQNSLFIKEFDLGSVGRRLKTWHKIKALQEEVTRATAPDVSRRSASEYSLGMEGEDTNVNVTRNRSSTIGAPSLPRALTTKRQSEGEPAPRRQVSQPNTPFMNRESVGMSPLQSMGSMSSTYRPSAQSIRNMNHSRRHSSIDSTSTDGVNRMSHRKQPSLDQKWQPGQPVNGRHGHTISADMQLPQRQPSVISPASPGDLDRGYFSSTEAESRTQRRSGLSKRNAISPGHSRQSSLLGSQPHLIADTDGYRDTVSPITPPSQHPTSMSSALSARFGTLRSATTPFAQSRYKASTRAPVNPVVTKLDPTKQSSPLSAIAGSPVQYEDNASEASSDKVTPSPSGFFSSAKAKVAGFRSISDAVTKDEKISSPTKINSAGRTTTGSSTPSIENPSLDMSKSDLASRESTGSGNLMPPPKRPRAKSKKFTSAYTRGLEQKTPAEQMLDCDYSGWMKKKSGSLMATWKTRLFILRGRRLSYYYSDGDTEEKGLIDISFHRVLPAHDEKVTAVLATMTGANTTSPIHGSTPTIAEQDLRNHPPRQGEQDDGLFIFKLIPPKVGLSKGVNFTKPMVHYFAVNSRQEGRLWMAALMKATIDRDDNGVVTTTYNQKTISLAKARERRERPPGLKEEDPDTTREHDADAAGGDAITSKGLGIGGLVESSHTVAGVEQDTEADVSTLASTLFSGESDFISEKGRQSIVAMHTAG